MFGMKYSVSLSRVLKFYHAHFLRKDYSINANGLKIYIKSNDSYDKAIRRIAFLRFYFFTVKEHIYVLFYLSYTLH